MSYASLATVWDSSWVSVFYRSKAKFCTSVWHSVNVVPEELVTLLLHLLFRLDYLLSLSFEYFSSKWGSPQRGTEETLYLFLNPQWVQHIASETLSVFLLLTAHALLAASSFTLTFFSVQTEHSHTILCNAKQGHTTMSGKLKHLPCRLSGQVL